MAAVEKAYDESILKALAKIGTRGGTKLHSDDGKLLISDPSLAGLTFEQRAKVREGLQQNARLLGLI
jgi:hypothetical protein